MPSHTIVTREEWLEARKTYLAKEKEFTGERAALGAQPIAQPRELLFLRKTYLAKEKEFTRLRDRLSAERRALPRELLFLRQIRLARLEPFLSRYDRVAWHRSSPSKSSGLVWVVESVSPAPVVPRSVLMASAASPPPEVAPATISAAVARHAGHMGHLLHPIRRSGGAQIDRSSLNRRSPGRPRSRSRDRHLEE